MPLQNIPQQNQPVGLQLLGDALMGGAADYAGRLDRDRTRNLALQDEQRRRGYQLSDVASNRAYEEGRQDKLRGLQLSDEQRRRGESFDDAKKRAEYDRKLAMLTEAARLGLFDMQLLGDAVAEEAALARLQQRQAQDAEFGRQQPQNALLDQAQIDLQLQELSGRAREINRILATPAKVDMKLVAARALEIATQQNGGNLPGRDLIIAAQPAALEEAQKAAMVQDYQEKEAARVQQQLIAIEMNALRQQKSTSVGTFKVTTPGAPAAPASALSEPPTPQNSGGNLGGFTAALDALLAKNNIGQGQGTVGARSSLQEIRDMTAARAAAPAELRPAFDQSKTQMLADAYVPYDNAREGAAQKLANIKSQIARIQNGTPVNVADAGYRPFFTMPGTPGSVVDPGRALTSLLQQQAQAERELQTAEQARRTGKASLLQVNTPAEAKPMVFPSAGALQSPAWAD